MFTPCPCWTETDGECKRRRMGCHAGCEDYTKWRAVHEAELDAIRKKKGERIEADSFELGRWKRDKQYYNEDYERRRRGK